MCSGDCRFYPRRRRTSEPLLYPLSLSVGTQPSMTAFASVTSG